MSAPVERLGKYELIRKLAMGGMAEVFLAKATGVMGFSKTLVVKRILPHLADDQRFVELFLREARLAAELTHPNVAQIFDFGEYDGRYFIAMEYVDGPNLRTIIKKSNESGASIPLTIAAKVISYACEGLGYAHMFADPETGEAKGFVHRDISPDNILISRTGAVKVADFGLAKAINSQTDTRPGTISGKLPYLSPEQIRGQRADRRADIHALGVTLYEAIAGRRPFQADNEVMLMQKVAKEAAPPLGSLRLDLPSELVAVVEKTLQKNPEARYQTCRELQTDLDAFLRQHTVSIGTFEIASYVATLAVPHPSALHKSLPPEDRAEPLPREPSANQAALSPPLSLTTKDKVSAAEDVARPMVSVTAEVQGPTQPRARMPLAPKRWQRPAVLGGVVALGLGLSFWLTPSRAPPTPPMLPEPGSAAMRPAAQAATAPAALPAPSPTPAAIAPAPVPAASERVEPAPAVTAAVLPSPTALEPSTPPQRFVVKNKPDKKSIAAARPPAREPALPPASGTVTVESVPSTQVWVDGAPKGRSPLSIKLPAGAHTVEFRDDEQGLRRKETIEVAKDQTRAVQWRPAKGTVVIRAWPYAEVFLKKKSLGVTPLEPVELFEGRYEFVFVNKTTAKQEAREVEVKPGAETLVKVDLRGN